MGKFLIFLCIIMCASLFGSSPQVIILLGAPGAGKGTQATFLKECYHLPHISTGDIFRENLKNNTLIGQKAKSYMDKGALVPDEIVMDMLFERLSLVDCKKGYILDGVPRTIAQAESLDKYLTGKANIIVLSLEVPDAMIIERLSGRLICEKCSAPYHKTALPSRQEGICDRCGGKLITRKDDTPEIISERLKAYHAQAKPLKEYYRAQGKLTLIDASLSKEETQAAIRPLA